MNKLNILGAIICTFTLMTIAGKEADMKAMRSEIKNVSRIQGDFQFTIHHMAVRQLNQKHQEYSPYIQCFTIIKFKSSDKSTF
jgi:hypothetical protein